MIIILLIILTVIAVLRFVWRAFPHELGSVSSGMIVTTDRAPLSIGHAVMINGQLFKVTAITDATITVEPL